MTCMTHHFSSATYNHTSQQIVKLDVKMIVSIVVFWFFYATNLPHDYKEN